MDWKKLVSIAVFLFFVSCISFYHHPKGGFRPKKPNFSLAKEKFIFNNLIDTTAIYINIDTLKVEDLKSVSYIKFCNNGRMYKNSLTPNKKIYNKDLFPTLIGYYNTSSKDRLKINFFEINALNKNETSYVIQKGYINQDTIFLENRFIKGDKDIYVKQKLDFIPEPSNW